MAYGTRRFNATFTRTFQQFLSRAESTQFLVMIPISLRSLLILSSHLRLCLPKGFCPEGLPVKILKALLPTSILATWLAHRVWKKEIGLERDSGQSFLLEIMHVLLNNYSDGIAVVVKEWSRELVKDVSTMGDWISPIRINTSKHHILSSEIRVSSWNQIC